MELLFNKNILILCGVIIFIIIFIIPGKSTGIYMKRIIKSYNELIIRYNNLLNDFSFLEQEISLYRYTKEDLTIIKEKLRIVNTNIEEFSYLINCMKKKIENKNSSGFKKLYKESLEVEKVLISLYEEIKSYIERGLTEEEYIEQKVKYEEEKRREYEQNQINEDVSFFAGCKTKETIEKRYKALCKVYHPDVGSGDTETFQKIQKEYERLSKKE